MKKSKVKVAVLVSGGGTNLQALLDYEKAGKLSDGEIVTVLSNNPSAYALERARAFGKKAVCVDRTVYKDLALREEQMVKLLDDDGIELIVLAGYLSILSEAFTKRYANRIINIHPSLIPSFCGKGYYGLKVHEAALSYGVKVTGATVHFVNEIPDGGEIIMQKAVNIEEGDTPELLQRRVMEQAEWKILPEALEKVCAKIRNEKQ